MESSPVKKPLKTENNSSAGTQEFELWSWGTNNLGQLGHGDTITRREAQKIRGVSGLILKVCVGDNHNIVLMASGEVIYKKKFAYYYMIALNLLGLCMGFKF